MFMIVSEIFQKGFNVGWGGGVGGLQIWFLIGLNLCVMKGDIFEVGVDFGGMKLIRSEESCDQKMC